MALVFRDGRHHRRQLDHLHAGRRRVTSAGRAGQGGVAVLALGRHESLEMIHPFGRQQLAQVGRMAGLAAAPAFGLLLDHRRRCSEGIGRRRHGGIGGGGAQACAEVADERFQLGDAPFQGRNACVTLATS
ncbi:MAG: hypothetical protein JNM56_25885 [Planctomycetia bacterium]|nr:hypothetical protein [Planctomycetia bacterium]